MTLLGSAVAGLAASPAAGGGGGGGGLVNDVMQAANQLGAGQAIDLLKGLVMPAIMQAARTVAPRARRVLPCRAWPACCAGRPLAPCRVSRVP